MALKSAPISVLMSVYYKETAPNLNASLASIMNQTLAPAEIVLVLDGPLTDALEQIINRWKSDNAERLNIIRLPLNQGLGAALNVGLTYCQNELVARMDSDDLAEPNRLEVQYQYLIANPNIDIVGAWIGEFEEDPLVISSTRRPPCDPLEVRKYAASRNPLNHPSVMFRRSAVERAGGYRDFLFFEDYYLWVRMILRGSSIANVPEVLLRFRTGTNFYKRRSGWKYLTMELAFQRKLLRIGFISPFTFFLNITSRLAFRVLPKPLVRMLYQSVLRTPIRSDRSIEPIVSQSRTYD